MTFHVLTLFPKMFRGFLTETMMKRALTAGVVNVNLVNIRDYATDKHRTTDDTPYGGGPGMVMRIEPIFNALKGLDQVQNAKRKAQKSHVVLLSPRGRQFTQSLADEYAKFDTLTLICGRYEGVDQRVADHLCDEELSIGPYVLSGGEVAAMVVMEAVARLVAGFLGNPESLKEESFAILGSGHETVGSSRKRRTPTAHSPLPTASVEYPQYTKPEGFRGWKVPAVLLSGNHKKIAEWRATHSTRT